MWSVDVENGNLRRGRVNIIYHTFESGDRSVGGIGHAVMINGVALLACRFAVRLRRQYIGTGERVKGGAMRE